MSDIRLHLAVALRAQERLDEAIQILEQLASTRSDPVSLVGLTDGLLAAGRVGEALATARSAVERYPDSADPNVMLGCVLIELRQLPEALDRLNRGLELAPNHLHALAKRGVALSLMREHTAAVEAFDEVARRDPEFFLREPDIATYAQASRAAARHEGERGGPAG